MKILELRLLAFGPFTDRMIDLRDGEKGLHIIYGPNEAGKTSALRALRQMLYGIPERSPDDFVHPHRKIRIGAVLRHSDGTVLEFIRRKGRKATLRAGDDESAIDEIVLERFLSGIDGDLFATMFGIGHADLVRGGKEILQGGGGVGQVLFAAGAGVTDLQRVQTELKEETDRLFKATGQKPRINERISMFRAKQRQLLDVQLPSQEWDQHDQTLREALERKAAMERELEERVREKHRLERIADAFPLIAQRKELLEGLSLCADAVLLPPEFLKRRNEVETDLRMGETEEKQSLASIMEISEKLQRIEVSRQILDNALLIEGLYKELGSHQKAMKDWSQLVSRKSLLEADAVAILSGIRQDLTLVEAQKQRLEKAQVVRIRDLGGVYERLIERLGNTKEDMSRLLTQLETLERQESGLETPRNLASLEQALERAGGQGVVEEQCHADTVEIQLAEARAESELRKQTLWSGTLEGFANLPVPLMETIDGFEFRFTEVLDEMSRLKRDIAGLDSELSHTEARLVVMRLEREVPTERDLEEARLHREGGWQLIRRVWLNREDPEQITRDFVAASAPANELAEAYELSVRKADEVADRLRREADRVARKAALLSEREKCGIDRDRLKAELRNAEAFMANIKEEWLAAWKPSGVIPRSPREMRAWAQNQKLLAEELSRIWERKLKAEELKTRIEAHRKELIGFLCATDEPISEGDSSLLELLKKGRSLIEANDKLVLEKERLSREIDQKRRELHEAQSRAKKAEQELFDWRGQWSDAVSPLGLQADASPNQANAVTEDFKILFDKLNEAEALQKRVKGIERDAEEFTRRVNDMIGRVAGDLRGLPVERAVTELNSRLTMARTAKARKDSLEAQRGREEERLGEARRRIAANRSRLASMCKEAGCSTQAELPEAEARSVKRREIEAELAEIGKQLLRLSGGQTVEAFLQDARQVDPDRIEARLGRLTQEINERTEEKSQLDQTIGSERVELGRMDGSARAADLAEELQGILAQLESDVEQYTRFRIASIVLGQAIERYREKNQAPVLTRSSDFFSKLTLGSFEGLRAEFGDQGEQVIVGVRPGGSEIVRVESMSDGTTDQLYLAIRLGSLENYLKENESIPFIVDDVLLRFDDERAAAALRIFADLSRKTQVIFFTHHKHLVRLAEAAVKNDVLIKHEL